MQTISSVLKVVLAVQRRTCVTEDDESRGGSSIRSTVSAKFKSKTWLTTDRRLTERNLSSELGISKNTVHRTVKYDLHKD